MVYKSNTVYNWTHNHKPPSIAYYDSKTNIMILYGLSIFLSAFLLFQIQPMIAKYILPWFGGISTVWSAVMLFFQVLLTGGYAYGHILISRVNTQRQWKIHTFLLALSVCLLLILAFFWTSPITPSESWKPYSVDNPIWHIFLLLAVSIGLPYFMLSTNSPLMQAWFNLAIPTKSPYQLYSLSNFASLLALLSYPIIFEPNIPLRWQGWMWSGLYFVFTLFAGFAALSSSRSRSNPIKDVPTPEPAGKSPPWVGLIFLWIALSATASILLLAVTNQITQEVASIPFLWILPLIVYLLSFILAFGSERWYKRVPYVLLLCLATIGILYILINPKSHYLVQLGFYSIFLFACFMVCHGELYRLRPNPSHLTLFYLMVSIGGALGGIFVSFVAPIIFNGYWEMNFGITLAWILLVMMTFLSPTPIKPHRLKFSFDVLVGSMAATMLIFSIFAISGFYSDTLTAERNFYGTLRVKESLNGNNDKVYLLVHGITVHGIQFSDPGKRNLPTSYYTDNAGGGLAILNHPMRGQGMKVGVLGLGIGTLAAYGLAGDEYRMYEINPAVAEFAEGKGGYFSYLADSKADVSVVLGDARISLERELATGMRQQFDVLVLDTFNSDSIPVHLVTKEAFELYLQHLEENGILAAHVSNEHLNFLPVFWQVANHFGLKLVVVSNEGNVANAGSPAIWILMSRNPALLENPAITDVTYPLNGYSTKVRLWTDDYSNLFQILR